MRDRAIRRAGELLKQIPPQKGKRTDLEPTDGDDTRLTRSNLEPSGDAPTRLQGSRGGKTELVSSASEVSAALPIYPRLYVSPLASADEERRPQSFRGRLPHQLSSGAHPAHADRRYHQLLERPAAGIDNSQGEIDCGASRAVGVKDQRLPLRRTFTAQPLRSPDARHRDVHHLGYRGECLRSSDILRELP